MTSCARSGTPPPGSSNPFVFVLEGAVPNEQINGDGHWAALRSASRSPGSRSRPAPGSTGWRRTPRPCWRSAPAPPTAAFRRCAGTRPARWACAITSAPAGSRGWACRSSTSRGARSSPTTSPRRCCTWRCTWPGSSRCSTSTSRAARDGCSGEPSRRAADGPGSPSRASSRPRRATIAAAWSSSGARGRWSSATSRSGVGPGASAAAPTSAGSAWPARCRASRTSSCRSWSPARLGAGRGAGAQFAYGPVAAAACGASDVEPLAPTGTELHIRRRCKLMPIRVIFRCDFCQAMPDPLTQLALERQLRELAFGEYLDVPPGRWLVWLGGGPLGPAPLRLRRHRGELTAYLREHYGTIAPNPWKRPPYPTTRRSADTERAIRNGGLSPMPKWGLGVSDADALQRTVYPGWLQAVRRVHGGRCRRAGAASSRRRPDGADARRSAGVAQGWSELARAMASAGAERVADLDAAEAGRFARAALGDPARRQPALSGRRLAESYCADLAARRPGRSTLESGAIRSSVEPGTGTEPLQKVSSCGGPVCRCSSPARRHSPVGAAGRARRRPRLPRRPPGGGARAPARSWHGRARVTARAAPPASGVMKRGRASARRPRGR